MPSFRFVSIFILAILSAGSPAFGQQLQSSQNAALRDVAATGVLQTALAAMGGQTMAATIQDCTLTGTIQTIASASAPSTAKSFTWTLSGAEFREEIDSGGKTNIFASGHGKPARSFGGLTSPINYHVARANLPFQLPALAVLQVLSNPNYSIKYVGMVKVENISVVQVHVSDNSDEVGKLVTPQDWYFDPLSQLPVRVEFRLPSNENAALFSTAALEFSNYKSVAGVTVPLALTYFEDGNPFATIIVSSAHFNSGVQVGTFDLTSGSAQ